MKKIEARNQENIQRRQFKSIWIEKDEEEMRRHCRPNSHRPPDKTRQDGPVCVVSGGVNWVGPAARQVRSASECVRRSHRQCLPKLINFPNQYYNFCRSSLFGNVKITVTFKRPFGHRDFSKCGILLNSSMNRGPKWLGGSTTKFSTISRLCERSNCECTEFVLYDYVWTEE